METIRFRMTGVSPLLLHNPEFLLTGPDGGVKAKTIPTPEEEAEKGLYRDEAGRLCIKARAFRRALDAAGKGRRIGKRGAKQLVMSTVFEQDELVPLIHPGTGELLTEWEIDRQRVVIQRAGILRSRPKFLEWACDITFEFEEDLITPSQIDDLANIAGRTIGVGDFRPECTGRFGRFRADVV